jgi:hypothetical protein
MQATTWTPKFSLALLAFALCRKYAVMPGLVVKSPLDAAFGAGTEI